MKDCPSLKKVNNFKVQYNKQPASAGDTLIAIPSFTNEFDEVEYFDDDMEFQVLITDGCEASDLLSPEGEIGKYFPAIKQPIKLIIHDTPKNGIVNLMMGLNSNYKYDIKLRY